MRKQFRIYLLMLIAGLLSFTGYAGNPDRVGQSGAVQLNINPWARSSGWNGANLAGVRGVEAMMSNVAGLTFAPKTEFIFSRTNWLSGSDININTFGFSQRMGAADNNVIGISIMSFNFGDIPITTTEMPDGGLGTFSPQFMNIGLAYSREFSNSIRGGALLRLVSESIHNVRSQGIAVDAGIQYVTGVKDRTKFGVSLKNVGSPMKYDGDGLAVRAAVEGVQFGEQTVEHRTAQFEMPSTLQIGFSYDIFMGDSSARAVDLHKLTFAGTFVSNAFAHDQIALGLQYGFKDMVMLRGGFIYEEDIFSGSRLNAFTGPSAGVSVDLPFGGRSREVGETITRKFGIDYSIRTTINFNHTHTFGARLSL